MEEKDGFGCNDYKKFTPFESSLNEEIVEHLHEFIPCAECEKKENCEQGNLGFNEPGMGCRDYKDFDPIDVDSWMFDEIKEISLED
jgi:hypothetical protein